MAPGAAFSPRLLVEIGPRQRVAADGAAAERNRRRRNSLSLAPSSGMPASSSTSLPERTCSRSPATSAPFARSARFQRRTRAGSSTVSGMAAVSHCCARAPSRDSFAACSAPGTPPARAASSRRSRANCSPSARRACGRGRAACASPARGRWRCARASSCEPRCACSSPSANSRPTPPTSSMRAQRSSRGRI